MTVDSHRYKTFIFIGIVLIAVTIVSTILLSKNASTYKNRSGVPYGRNAEEDNNVPVEYFTGTIAIIL